jgi:hypothetical protein
MAGDNLESGDGSNQNRGMSVEASSQLNSIELLSTAPPVTNTTDTGTANGQHVTDSASHNNASSQELFFDNSIYNNSSNVLQSGARDSTNGGADSAPANNVATGGKDAAQINIPGNLEPSITPSAPTKPFADAFKNQINSVVPRQLEQRTPAGGQSAVLQGSQRAHGARQR